MSSKPERAEDVISRTVETLKRKHGEHSDQPYKFRLWAEMVVRLIF
jgi:hypothetical protein